MLFPLSPLVPLALFSCNSLIDSNFFVVLKKITIDKKKAQLLTNYVLYLLFLPQLYFTGVAVVTFFIPAVIIAGCYTAIIYIIWSKGRTQTPSCGSCFNCNKPTPVTSSGNLTGCRSRSRCRWFGSSVVQLASPSLCLSLSLFLSVSIYLSPSLCLSLSLFLSVSIYLSPSLCLPLSLFLSVSIYLSPSLSMHLCILYTYMRVCIEARM